MFGPTKSVPETVESAFKKSELASFDGDDKPAVSIYEIVNLKPEPEDEGICSPLANIALLTFH
jgi:hypothetical protein